MVSPETSIRQKPGPILNQPAGQLGGGFAPVSLTRTRFEEAPLAAVQDKSTNDEPEVTWHE